MKRKKDNLFELFADVVLATSSCSGPTTSNPDILALHDLAMEYTEQECREQPDFKEKLEKAVKAMNDEAMSRRFNAIK